jgi:hypothetical protein
MGRKQADGQSRLDSHEWTARRPAQPVAHRPTWPAAPVTRLARVWASRPAQAAARSLGSMGRKWPNRRRTGSPFPPFFLFLVAFPPLLLPSGGGRVRRLLVVGVAVPRPVAKSRFGMARAGSGSSGSWWVRVGACACGGAARRGGGGWISLTRLLLRAVTVGAAARG